MLEGLQSFVPDRTPELADICLNVALAIQAPGPVAEGNWAVGAYIDQRADEKQTEALGAVFTGGWRAHGGFRAADLQEPRG